MILPSTFHHILKALTLLCHKNQGRPEPTSSSSMTSLEDLGDEDLFTSSSPTESGRAGNTGDYEREDPPANLPVKAKSNLSSIAANIAKNRDILDSTIPRPTRNNIVPTL